MQLFDLHLAAAAMLAVVEPWPTRGDVVRLVILALDVAAILSVVAGHGSLLRKLGWTAVILLLPVAGMVLYFLCGRSSKDA